jgi:hypothetical protein
LYTATVNTDRKAALLLFLDRISGATLPGLNHSKRSVALQERVISRMKQLLATQLAAIFKRGVAATTTAYKQRSVEFFRTVDLHAGIPH